MHVLGRQTRRKHDAEKYNELKLVPLEHDAPKKGPDCTTLGHSTGERIALFQRCGCGWSDLGTGASPGGHDRHCQHLEPDGMSSREQLQLGGERSRDVLR